MTCALTIERRGLVQDQLCLRVVIGRSGRLAQFPPIPHGSLIQGPAPHAISICIVVPYSGTAIKGIRTNSLSRQQIAGASGRLLIIRTGSLRATRPSETCQVCWIYATKYMLNAE